jgi:hypothetical protein
MRERWPKPARERTKPPREVFDGPDGELRPAGMTSLIHHRYCPHRVGSRGGHRRFGDGKVLFDGSLRVVKPQSRIRPRHFLSSRA